MNVFFTIVYTYGKLCDVTYLSHVRGVFMNNNIKKLREELNLSQKTLADTVGVCRETICKLEAGKYNPSLRLAHNISRALGVCIETVFEFED